MQDELILPNAEAPRQRRAAWKYVALAVGVAMAGIVSFILNPPVIDHLQSPQYRDGRFRNVVPRPERGFWESMAL